MMRIVFAALFLAALPAFAQVRADLSIHYTTDTIFDNMDTGADFDGYFDALNTYNLIANGLGFTADGLPANRIVPSLGAMGFYQLGDYSRTNAIKFFTGDSASIPIHMPTDEIGFLGASADGNSTLRVTVHYADNSTEVFENGFRAPDWFNAASGVPSPVTGRDRVQWSAAQNRWNLHNANACRLFESTILPTGGQTITHIVVEGTNLSNPGRTAASLFAVNVRVGATSFQIDLSSLANTDAVFDGTGPSSDAGGFFDQFNTFNYTAPTASFASVGVPNDRLLTSTSTGLGRHLLADYRSQNAIAMLFNAVTVDVPPGRYKRVGVIFSSANGESELAVERHYDSGDPGSETTPVPDWFNASAPVPTILGGMDRAQKNLIETAWRFEFRRAARLFEYVGAVDPARSLVSIGMVYTNGPGEPFVFSINLQPAADVNNNGCVDDADLAQVLEDFGSTNPASDIDGNGIVDDADLAIVLESFGMGCH